MQWNLTRARRRTASTFRNARPPEPALRLATITQGRLRPLLPAKFYFGPIRKTASKKNKGAVNISESMRSSAPPWPGNMELESFIFE